MIGVDTNILLRFLVADDEAQHQLARHLFEQKVDEKNQAYVNLVVTAEIGWALLKLYKIEKGIVIKLFMALLSKSEIVFEREECLFKALRVFENQNVDFHDALIAQINRSQSIIETFTFDKTASQRIEGYTLLSAEHAA